LYGYTSHVCPVEDNIVQFFPAQQVSARLSISFVA
jgi:hypothetical protein